MYGSKAREQRGRYSIVVIAREGAEAGEEAGEEYPIIGREVALPYHSPNNLPSLIPLTVKSKSSHPSSVSGICESVNTGQA